MTTNDATPRERIVAAVDMQMAGLYVEQAGELLQVGDAYDIAMGMIAHLWERADDPAVVEAVAKANYQEDWQGMLEWEDEQGSPDVREWIEEASKWTRLVLTALLGPRPQESDDEEEGV